MRELIKEFVRIAAATLPIADPIYEFGSLQVPEQIGWADLRPIFPGHKYIGGDMRKGPGVDTILDLHKLDLLNESVGTAFCLDTLKHVERPYDALAEMYRVLRLDGACIISSVLAFPIHEYPADYWRFTAAGFKLILRPFTSVMTGYVGEDHFPHTILGVGVKGPADFAAFAGACWERLAMRVA